MKTALPDHVAAPYYKQLEETIKELFAGPQAELEDLIAKYGHLIDGTDEAQNEKYSGDNFTFEEAVEDIKKARFEISSSISSKFHFRWLKIFHDSSAPIQVALRLTI